MKEMWMRTQNDWAAFTTQPQPLNNRQFSYLKLLASSQDASRIQREDAENLTDTGECSVCADVAQISDMMTEDTSKHVNKDEDAEKKTGGRRGHWRRRDGENRRDYIILLEENIWYRLGIRKE